MSLRQFKVTPPISPHHRICPTKFCIHCHAQPPSRPCIRWTLIPQDDSKHTLLYSTLVSVASVDSPCRDDKLANGETTSTAEPSHSEMRKSHQSGALCVIR